ncbi:hypothetical protein CASFOL_022342 [Castilleja foliolosa]|uniref:Myb/SANT-like domain-containing protein n=1 Tax=Castilleja foliolosa TaxID=1961234 RepID=A0ABD3CY43_9LAMI
MNDPPPYPNSPYPYDLPQLLRVGNAYFEADSSKWNLKTDEMLLEFLITEKDRGRLNPNEGPYKDSAQEARNLLQSFFGIELSLDDVVHRIEFLKTRYDFFCKLIHSKGTIWFHEYGVVSGDHNVFKKMEGTDVVSYCNVWEEEPLFTKMEALFMEDKQNTNTSNSEAGTSASGISKGKK